MNDGTLRYVIKSRSERKLNCRQQAESQARGIKDPRRLHNGKATAAGGSLSEMWRRGRAHHRAV